MPSFRGAKSTVKAGETIHIPANAPHQFRNAADQAARLLCICAPAGQEDFFTQLGTPVETRTTPPPKPTPEAETKFRDQAQALAPKYKTEFLPPA